MPTDTLSPMLRAALLFTATLAALPAGAQTEGTPPYDDALAAAIRAYILDHPEIVLEAMQVLADRDARAQEAALIAAHAAPFFEAAPRLGIGPPDAPRRIVEFFDYRCAPCRAAHPTLEALAAATGDVRVEMVQLPILSPSSERATRFALAVEIAHGAAAYARAHEILFATMGPYTTARFEEIAAAEGWDMAAIDAATDDPAVTDRIARNRDLAVALGLVGTPAFLSPERIVVGATDKARLQPLFTPAPE